MLGSEHKKERVSERLQGLNNQPRHRGYLPGCHTRAADVDGRTAYSVKTLQGNWAEERRDVAYSEDKPVISTELESQWQTTYTRMVNEGTRNANLKPANHVTQSDLVDIIDGRNQCFPGHQPIHDPTYKSTVASTFLTTTITTYKNPREVQQAAKEYVPPVLGGSPDAQPRAVILRARHRLLQQEGTFAELRRALRSMDTVGNGRLNNRELQAGLAKYNIPLSDAEISVLMNYFDKKGTGDVNISEFVKGMRGAMSDRRLDLVKKAYSLLDACCGGVVRLDDILRLYDVSAHPDVTAKKVSPQLARKRFASQWDVPNGDDVIEFAEFRDYYEDVSSVIDNEQFFELMMRNTWHISGGEGLCRNTSCRRVLVTHTTGRQTQQEIRNDLGISADDIDKMILNLNNQGITDVARVELL